MEVTNLKYKKIHILHIRTAQMNNYCQSVLNNTDAQLKHHTQELQTPIKYSLQTLTKLNKLATIKLKC